MSNFKQRISEVLIAQSLATKDQLDPLIAESSKGGQSFGRLLIERGVIPESKLTELLSKELGIPMISLAKYLIEPDVVKLIPERIARQHNLVPLAKFGDRMVVAMSDPLNIFAIDDLKALTQVEVDPVLSPETDVVAAIEQVYTSQAGLTLTAEEKKTPADGSGPEEENIDTAVAILLDESKEETAPVVRIINLMVIEAMRRHASDIHLESSEHSLRVRYRVDGHLIDSHRLPKSIQSPILTRLKIMSGMDITEWRLPQDGRFKVKLEEREVDFRVSVLPITKGGKVVLRLLDKSNLSIGLDNLGFLPESIEQFKSAVKRPYGMILVTGPTGSGKSTTLYSVLNQLNHPTKNLITIEDPVEYQVEGITQMQVNAEIDLTFASGLRAILRQSPDVVMIGEIRDFETADIAMKASLTGQLVLSTLHTNDAPSAVTRLIDMGVEPFLVASSVNLIEAQRLVRKLCLKCRERFEPAPALLERLEIRPTKDATFFKPSGCKTCNDTGYKGRMGIIEVFQVDERVRELIISRGHSWEIKDYAVQSLGMIPLRQDGFRKAQQGVTTLEEVLAVTTAE